MKQTACCLENSQPMTTYLFICLLNQNSEVTKYIHEPPTTEQNAVDILNNIILPQYAQNNFGRWAVHTKGDEEFIGWCGLKKHPIIFFLI